MYEAHFGLRSPPFHITPDPGLLFLTPGHQEALGTVLYGILGRKGFVLLTGEVGTGKTTVLRRALEHFPADQAEVIYVLQPVLTPGDFLRMLQRELAGEDEVLDAASDLDAVVADIQKRLIARHRKGRIVVIAIDEAQTMPPEALETLRLLSNLETATEKLLQIVLVGQPELETLLARHELRQLEQRIAVRARIPPLTRGEAHRYIAHRLDASAETSVRPFSRAAEAFLVEEARGNPRRLNILCDNALLNAYGHGARKVSLSIAREAAKPLAGREKPSRLRLPFRFRPAYAAAAGLLILLPALWVATDPLSLFSRSAEAVGPSAQNSSTQPAFTLTTPAEKPAPASEPATAAAPPALPLAPIDTVVPVERPRAVPPLPPGADAAPAGVPSPAAPPAAGAPVRRALAAGETVLRLCIKVYGGCSGEELRVIQKANPEIANLSRVQVGQVIVFPAINNGRTARAPGG